MPFRGVLARLCSEARRASFNEKLISRVSRRLLQKERSLRLFLRLFVSFAVEFLSYLVFCLVPLHVAPPPHRFKLLHRVSSRAALLPLFASLFNLVELLVT